MKLLYYIYTLAFIFAFTSCSKEEVENNVMIEDNHITTVSQDGFLPGDEYTRATLSYGERGLTLKWQKGDEFGIFPTSDGDGKEINSGNSSQQGFKWEETTEDDTQWATIKPHYEEFTFVESYGYTAYYPYKDEEDLSYTSIPFDFSNQIQKGYVNMGAYYKKGGFDANEYKESELLACEHLCKADVLISPEMLTSSKNMHFPMRHIGAVARFFLLLPAKQLKVKELRLISNNKIFYTKGTANLTRHPYKKGFTPSITPLNSSTTATTDKFNYGVCLPQFANNQIAVDEQSKTDCLLLKFGTDASASGIESLYGKSNAYNYGNYFISYMMMYPITTTDADNVYIYVVAEDLSTHKDIFLRTKKLDNQKMFSGYVYQWNERTNEDTVIELTATLQSWQEVASGAIETDLEK